MRWPGHSGQSHWPAGQELLLFPLHPSVREADVSCHPEQLVGAAARLSDELAPSWALMGVQAAGPHIPPTRPWGRNPIFLKNRTVCLSWL